MPWSSQLAIREMKVVLAVAPSSEPTNSQFFPADSFFSKVPLGDVVGHRQATVVEETLEGLLLVDGVADGRVHRRVVEDEILLGAAPGEEVPNDGARFLVARRLLFFRVSFVMVRSILNSAARYASATFARSGSDASALKK